MISENINEKYIHFGLVGLSGKYQFELVEKKLLEPIVYTDNEYKNRVIKSHISWNMAYACEIALKSLLISTDFIKIPCFTHTRTERDISYYNGDQPIYSYYPQMNGEDLGGIWRNILDGNLSLQDKSKYSDPRFGILGNPQKLLSEISKYALDGDLRKNEGYMKKDEINPFGKKEKISGHDLYAYLRLQSPEIQVLINSGLYLLGSRVTLEEKIIGILEGFFPNDINNTIYQASIQKKSRAFEKDRFNWVSGEKISDEDLYSLINFASVISNIISYKFPEKILLKKMCKEDYSKFDNTFFSTLDPVAKYYAKYYFHEEELKNLIEIVHENNLNPSDINCYLNLCIYFKYYIKEILNDKSSILDFKKDYAKSIYNYMIYLKKYNAKKNIRLEDSDIFIESMPEITAIRVAIQTYHNRYDNNIDQLTDSTVKLALSYSLASDLHEEWKRLRKNDNGTFVPRIKISTDEEWNESHGTNQVDIANCSFEELPSNWQYENLEAAKVVINSICDCIINGKDIDYEKVQQIASTIHEDWKKRNTWVYDPNNGDPKLAAPYNNLPITEKHKCISQLMPAIKKIHEYKLGLINVDEICEQYGIQSSGKRL